MSIQKPGNDEVGFAIKVIFLNRIVDIRATPNIWRSRGADESLVEAVSADDE